MLLVVPVTVAVIEVAVRGGDAGCDDRNLSSEEGNGDNDGGDCG